MINKSSIIKIITRSVFESTIISIANLINKYIFSNQLNYYLTDSPHLSPMNSARIFASRSHLIEWINSVLQIQMTKIQQLGSGVIYCLLLDCGYPYRVPIPKLKWYANNQVDYIYNFKILQNTFQHLGIDKKIQVLLCQNQINKLIKAKYQDNLDFVQWLKWFLQPKIDYKQYDAPKRRDHKDVYLDFYEHKILKLPSESHKTIQKSLHKNKQHLKINKQLKKIYDTSTHHFLQIYDSKTDDYDFQLINGQGKYRSKQKPTLKTSHNYIHKKPSISITPTDELFVSSNMHLPQANKQNACMSMNNTTIPNESVTSLHCIYSSPKQIKKFFFPQRFSQRLKRRVDVINEFRKSQIKRMEDNERHTLEKDQNLKRQIYCVKSHIFLDEEQSDIESKADA